MTSQADEAFCEPRGSNGGPVVATEVFCGCSPGQISRVIHDSSMINQWWIYDSSELHVINSSVIHQWIDLALTMVYPESQVNGFIIFNHPISPKNRHLWRYLMVRTFSFLPHFQSYPFGTCDFRNPRRNFTVILVRQRCRRLLSCWKQPLSKEIWHIYIYLPIIYT